MGSGLAFLPIGPSLQAPRCGAMHRGQRWPDEGQRGLIAADGEATRLGELTRVVNKHLLPVGAWPMIYYPLQLSSSRASARC